MDTKALRYTCIAIAILLAAPVARAEVFRMEAPPTDVANLDYEVQLLRIALEHAGDHELLLIEAERAGPSNQGRFIRQFSDGNSPFNVIFSGYSLEREHLLEMIPIPLTRGLLGHRLLFIEQATDSTLASIHSLADLTDRITLGMAISHPERPIYEAAGFHVTTAPSDRQWDLLALGRFQALLFGADESAPLLMNSGGIREGGEITISNEVRLSYPYDSFFYVAKGDKARAAIIEQGLKAAYASGAYMAHFERYPAIRDGLALLAKTDRRVFWIDNPYVSDRFRAIPDEYWHMPPPHKRED